MFGTDLDKVHKFLAQKGHAPLRDGELLIWLRHWLKGELGRNFKQCWERENSGSFYAGIFTPDEFVEITQAIEWLDELSK